MKRILCIILLIASMLSAFSVIVFSDDNAQSGSGDTQGMATGYAWYNTYQYLWKVTLFVGKSDQVSKQSNLTNDFHRIGTVIMKKSGWDIPTSVKFGSGTKVDYYSGTTLSVADSPTIISDYYCPPVPVACDGDINTVKSYFGSTGTLTTVLNAIATDKGTTKERLLSSLNFTIGGQTKTGWSYDYVAPNGSSNRVPWLIVYEPMVILNLKDKVTKLAFTATEFALAEMYGWYDWNYSGGNGQNCELLPQVHLPTSVQLEESWFGYPVYAVTNNNYHWKNEDIVKGGGWGMRWLSPAIKEPSQPLIDYSCYFGQVVTPEVGGNGTVEVTWMNYTSTAGTVLCELYRDSVLIWSGNKTLSGGEGIKSTFSVYYGRAGTQTLTCRINYTNRTKETDPNDNVDTAYVTPTGTSTSNGIDYGVRISDIGQPDQDSTVFVDVEWRNWTDKSGTVLCELYQNGELLWSDYKTFSAYCVYKSTYNIYFAGTYTRPFEARINYVNRSKETDPNDNIATEYVTPTKTVDDTYDFSVSDITVLPNKTYEGEYVEISFVSDNWNRDLSYENILVEVLVDGVVKKTEYVDFAPYGRNHHTYNLLINGQGAKNITARINWQWIDYEANRYNNSIATNASVIPYYEFSITNLKIDPSTCFEGESITVTFRTDSWDKNNAYEDIPVELLYNDKVIYTEYVDYSAYGGNNHRLKLNVGSTAGINNVKVRVNWSDHYNEIYTGNNETESVQLTVKPKLDLGIEAISPNSDYRAGMTVITSFRIYNYSDMDILPNHSNTVSFESYYYNGSYKVLISSQEWSQAVIPAKNNNLVYFKWTIPSHIAGKPVFCDAKVNSDMTIDEYSYTNNSASLIRTVSSVNTSQTPNTQYEETRPEDFTITDSPSEKAGSATWSLWIYSNGNFIRKNFGIAISSAIPSITPDEGSPSAEYKSDQWYMRSGYGINLSYCPVITSLSGYTMPASSAYTDVQQSEAMFPEFNYGTSNGEFRSLERQNGVWMFECNKTADQEERLHFTPLWFPNGSYVISVKATEVWTPAGMISSLRNSNDITIVDSAYDDWYVGEE